MMLISLIVMGFVLYCVVSHFISYTVFKNRILRRQKWDLNICCGHTDGGGVNADIVQHKAVPNFLKVDDVYNLPFRTGEFGSVLCSHTIEHVDDPERFFKELERVGTEVTVVIPPLYDITAAFNFFEHKTLFFSFRKVHHSLPRHARLPFSRFIQKHLGQNIEASAIPLATIFSGWRNRKSKNRR